MSDAPDAELLEQFARNGSEGAFAALVQRHLNLVYTTALRHTANPHAAEEITQAVFIILARKAGSLGRGTVLPGWLYQTARLAAANWRRAEARRIRREQEAFMQSTVESSPPDLTWRELAPHLDDAMAGLGTADRDALVLRYFQNKSLQEVGAALGVEERAAQKRVLRALEKLRKLFSRRGVTLTATAIAGAVSANAVQAAPGGLATAVTAVARAGAVVPATLAVLVEGTMKTLTWLKMKFAAATVTAILAAGTVLIAFGPKPVPGKSEPAPGQRPPSAETAIVTGPAPAAPVVVREPFTEAACFTLNTPPGGVALQPDGRIVIGTTLFGFCLDEKTGMLGQYRRGAMRLNSDGRLDRSFFCNVGRSDSSAFSAHVALAGEGRLFLSGIFTNVDGRPRPGYARLLPEGSVDESFEPWRNSTNVPPRTMVPGGLYWATWLPNGTAAILTGAIEGTRAPYPATVYRLDIAGKWLQPATDLLASEFLRPSGLALTLGEVGFWARRPVDWSSDTPQPSEPVGDLPFDRRTTGVPTAYDAAKVFRALFEEVPMELCRYAVRLPDDGVILAIREGNVSNMISPGGFMKFDRNWKPDFSFTNHYEADVRSRLTLKQQKDGKLLVAGLIGRMNGEDFPGLVRLDRNGQLDRSFRCTTANTEEGLPTEVQSMGGRVMDMAIQEDGRIVICGFFNNVNGIAAPHVARLNPDGSLDGSFRPPFMTQKEFDRERFGKKRPLPVTQLAATSAAAPAAGSMANPTGAQTILITLINYFGDAATIQFTGAANRQYILQARESLRDDWESISTNRANALGAGMFRDGDAGKHPMRFYRIATP